jgi:ribose 5-phosphate isomerase B
MRIVLACDHAGFELKESLKSFVASLGHDVEDVGALEYRATDDYTDFVPLAAHKVLEDPVNTRAIILGGSGQGEAIAANRFKGIRAVVYVGEPEGDRVEDIITLSREHNNANILSLGARFLNEEQAKTAVEKWLHTTFSNDERHIRRNEALDSIH